MIDRGQWAYVSGLVSAFQDRLLDRRALLALRRPADAAELQTRLRQSLLFSDGGIGPQPAEQVTERFEAFVRQICDASPDGRIGDFFLLSREWQIYRDIAKRAVLTDARGIGVASDIPTEEEMRFLPLFRRDKSALGDDPFSAATRHILSNLPQGEDRLGRLDLMVDAFEAAALRRSVAALGSDELSEWIGQWIRLKAAQTILRCRRHEWDCASFGEDWRAAGFDDVPLDGLLRGTTTDDVYLLSQLGLRDADSLLNEPDFVVAMTRRVDDLLTRRLSEASGIPFGPERVFAFLWNLRNEAVNLKLILAGAVYDIPDERIEHELRAAHV